MDRILVFDKGKIVEEALTANFLQKRGFTNAYGMLKLAAFWVMIQ
jgi:ABC-type multidrug transport system fused ATPase/permease subunit